MADNGRLWSVIVAVGAGVLLSACAPTRSSPANTDWQPIFDGDTLNGWTPKVRGAAAGENYNDIFRAGDGVLSVSFDQQDAFDDRFGHLFYDASLSYYRLRLDYRFTGEQSTGGPAWANRNGGVMLHAQSPQSMGVDQAFPVSIEAQFLGELPDLQPGRTTGNVCTPGTHIVMNGDLVTQHCIPSDVPALPLGEWVSFEAEVCGAETIRLFVNGEVSFELSEPQFDENDGDAAPFIGPDPSVREGYFALQAESHPIEMRNIEMMRLSADTCGVAADL